MLDVSPKNLWTEIQAAEQFRDAHLDSLTEMVQRYAGVGYHHEYEAEWSENHMYEFVRLTTSSVIFDNPRVRVRTRRPNPAQKLVAQAMEHALNRWVKDTQLQRLLKRAYVQQCFAYAVIQTAVEPRPEADPREPSMRQWPQCYLIPQERFYMDPLCQVFSHARYVGHKYTIDKSDLLLRADDKGSGWNEEAIESLGDNTGVETLAHNRQRENVDRKEIVVYETWVPEIDTDDPENGFHGTIFTTAVGGANSAEDSEGLEIREPRAFYGPRWGPYTMFGVYPVPGDPYPLSPFAAMYTQMQDLNDIVRASNQAIRKYKKVVVADASNPDLKKLKSAPNDFFLPIKGFDKSKIDSAEFGGITAQHKDQQAQALDRLDRNTGINQTQRGEVASGSTATEIAIADSAKDDSLSFVKQEFNANTTQLINGVGFYLYHDDRIEFPLGEEAAESVIDPETGEPMGEPWFVGGSHRSDSGARYDDLELDPEPYSMERANEALMRAQYNEATDFALRAASIVPMAPFYDWKRLFDKMGEILNDREFSEFYSPEIAGQLMGMNMAQQMAPEVPGTQQPMDASGKGSGLPGNQTGAALSGTRSKAGV